jgi:Spy/CpxP family protein refolding chaperone
MSMHRALLVPLALLLALLVGLSSPAQDKEKKKDPNDEKPAAKLKGPLPAHFKKLGLSDKQKQQVLKIMADSRAKVAQLQKEIKDTRDKARKDAEAVLTPDQRKLLRKLKTGDE